MLHFIYFDFFFVFFLKNNMSDDPPQLNRPRGRGRQQTAPVVDPRIPPIRRPADSVNILF